MKKGIICIETEWEITQKNNRLNMNTEALLEFLNKTCKIPYIYRQIATQAELQYYLIQFQKKEYAKYKVLYFSFHGWTQSIYLEGEQQGLSLEQLIELGGNVFDGRFVHFSSCRTLLGSQRKLEMFKAFSKATLVTGYTKQVDSTLSAIHDIALFKELIESKHLPKTFKRLTKMYTGLEELLGFRYLY